MRKPVNCFILAAGLGERLRPVTDYIPKPLVPVLGKPVLQSLLEKVTALPSVARIGINLHYKKELIEDWIIRSVYREKALLFPESPVLGTGGALKNAEAFLGAGVFLVHNSDILSGIDLGTLLESHVSSGNLVTLAVHDRPEFNNVAVDRGGIMRGVGKTHALSDAEYWTAFTGVAVYSPEFLKFLPEGRSGVVDAWLKAIAAGYSIGTHDVGGCFWSDIGTPASYTSAVLDMLRADGETVYIHPSSGGCRDADLDGYLSVESGVVLCKGVSLRNCILLPGSRPEEGVYENCIVGPGFRIDVGEFEEGLESKGGAVFIGTGGSDRKYFRVKRGDGTAVLMQCSPDDRDFHRHIEYTGFFRRHSVPVPELLETDVQNMTALFEDLGDMSLYSWLKCGRTEEQTERMYRGVLDVLVTLHTSAGHLQECPLLSERIFDYEHLRWETGYFIGRFIKGARDIAPEEPAALEGEFHRLALRADSFPKTVIHRDFQSQNIMVTKGRVPRLIDYQGARVGPPAYDIASILWDPYYRLEGPLRERLLSYYTGRMESAGKGFSAGDFMESLLPCRLQRHMQALGAYGFLSLVKGKKYFLRHAVEGVRLLKEDMAAAKNEYPVLHDLVVRL